MEPEGNLRNRFLNSNMMILPKRESILRRPIKSAGRANRETVDEEYIKEQRRLEAKRAKLQQIEEQRRIMSGEAPKSEINRAYEQLRQKQLELIENKRLSKLAERDMDAQYYTHTVESERREIMTEQMMREQKRQREREIALENLRLAELRKREREAIRLKEIEEERAALNGNIRTNRLI